MLSIIKDLSNDGKCLHTALERYHLNNSFYSLEEYSNQNMLWSSFFSTSSFCRCTSSSSLSYIFHLLSVGLTRKYLIFSFFNMRDVRNMKSPAAMHMSSFSSTFSFKCHMVYLLNCHCPQNVDRKQQY